MQMREYHVRKLERENREALAWKIAYGFKLSQPKALDRKWLTQKLLEDAVGNCLDDTERELRGIISRLARRLRSRRLARDVVGGILSHVRL